MTKDKKPSEKISPAQNDKDYGSNSMQIEQNLRKFLNSSSKEFNVRSSINKFVVDMAKRNLLKDVKEYKEKKHYPSKKDKDRVKSKSKAKGSKLARSALTDKTL